MDDNVVALNHSSPIRFDLSGMVNGLNNQTPQGTSIEAHDLATGRFVESYFPEAEDAFVMAMM